MGKNFDSNIATSTTPDASPESKWVAWAMWSSISLAAVLFVVFAGGFNTGLLLGWVVGIIIAAMMVVFRR
jgi:hypothetical protein